MNSSIKNAAAAYVSGKVLSSFRFRWIFYGAAAYFGLRYMKKHGIMEKQADAGLNMINSGIEKAKSQVGLGSSKPTQTAQTTPSSEQFTH